MTDNQVITKPTADIKTINLIEGQFSTSEASDILNTMLDKKINFHRLQVLSRTEGNSDDTCVRDSGRINELLSEKSKLKEILKNARENGQKLSISSLIKIEVID